MAKNKLSIYLLKEDVNNLEDIFKQDMKIFKKYNENKVAYCLDSHIHEPKWVKNFFNVESSNLCQANSKIILLVTREFESKKRIFALTFGFAKTLFKESVLEEQFGLKVVLNSVPINGLRKISKVNIGGNQKQAQEQIPKTGKISEFGFNVNSDLIKNVTALSEPEIFEKAIITGGDIFSLTVDRNVDNIEDFLDFCYQKYQEDTYKNNFDWIDNIKAISNKDMCEKLDKKMLEHINAKNYDNVWMAVPEVINWENIKGFRYSGSRDLYDDINIKKFIENMQEDPITSIDKFKNKTIRAISAEDETTDAISWSANKCLIAEIEYEGNNYCFNNSHWYKIDRDFAEQVKNEYNTMSISSLNLQDYSSEGQENYTEDNYNETLAENLNAALIHKIGEIPYGGGRGNKIEVCDVLTQNREMLHIKKSGGSSMLSHLFNQAVVSAEALIDNDFRTKYNNKLREHDYLTFIVPEFHTSDFTVVLGIIGKEENDRPKIPFFSKVAIRYAYKAIQNMGYSVAIKNIKNNDI